MKYAACLFLFSVISFASCRKKDKHIKKCNYALFALKETRPGYYKMVTVDTTTGSSIDSLPFPEVYGAQGYLDPRSKCYYTIEADNYGILRLYKFDFENKTTSVSKGLGWGGKSTFELTYSNTSKSFYFLHVDETNYVPQSHLYLVKIFGDSISFEGIELQPKQYNFYDALLANEKTGEIYFEKEHTRYKMDPSNLKVEKVSTSFEIASWPYYSRNDNMIYGARSGGGDTLVLLRENPLDGTTSKIGMVSPPIYPVFKFDTRYVNGAFDECRNQYIFHKVVSGDNAYIYWLDIKTGGLVKHLKSQEPYARLFCVNLN